MDKYNTKVVELQKVTNKYNVLLLENVALYDLISQLAPEKPINDDEQGGCVWCGHSEEQWFYETGKSERGSMYCDKRPETHKPDCPWLIAQQVLNDNSSIRE